MSEKKETKVVENEVTKDQEVKESKPVKGAVPAPVIINVYAAAQDQMVKDSSIT